MNDRLTAISEVGTPYYPHCFKDETCGGAGGNCEKCDFAEEVCSRLAAYENTYLSPEDVEEIKKMYSRAQERISKLYNNSAPLREETAQYAKRCVKIGFERDIWKVACVISWIGMVVNIFLNLI